MKTKKRKCLVPQCKEVFFSRGLCRGHYIYAARLVRKGEYTWAGLERQGKVLPPAAGRKAGALREWFSEGGRK